MNKQKIKEIVKFSLRKNIQNKWFIILNSFLLIVIVLMVNASNVADFLEKNNIDLFHDDIKIDYVDKENLIGNSLEKAFEEDEKVKVEQIAENIYTEETIENHVVVEVLSS